MNKNRGIHIISGFPGKDFGPELKYLISDIGVGGLIFFSDNIENPLQLAKLCTRIQKHALGVLDRPLFLMIDHEGGRVQRCGKPFFLIPAASEIAKSGIDPKKYPEIAAKELKLVGLNVNLAPVADIEPRSPHQFLRGRTFGDNPEIVSRYVLGALHVFIQNSIIPTVKHFPGLGEAVQDPHETLPVIRRNLAEIMNWELVPFANAIKAGCPCMMTSHALYPAIDEKLPATLSRKIMVELLRKQLGYAGVVISDDLEMGAISKFGDLEIVLDLAMESENDFLLFCHDIDLVSRAQEFLNSHMGYEKFTTYHIDSLPRIEQLYGLLDKNNIIPDIEKVKEYFKL